MNLDQAEKIIDALIDRPAGANYLPAGCHGTPGRVLVSDLDFADGRPCLSCRVEGWPGTCVSRPVAAVDLPADICAAEAAEAAALVAADRWPE